MKVLPLICFAVLLCVTQDVSSQPSRVLLEKIPSWVDKVAFEHDATAPAGQESGYYYLLIDEQENTLQQQRFRHFAYKVLTSEGIQEMSDLTFAWDPRYEKIILHRVEVHRRGRVINQLSSDIQTIQREQSMDRFLYDGSLTAVVNLKDVRVGDVIEYAYTTQGYNPVYDGHLSRKLYFNFNLPYEKLYKRLIVSPELPLELEYRNGDIKAEVKTTGAQKEYVWPLKGAGGLIQDSNLPGWYDGNQYVMISDFRNWGEVARWASKHFETDAGSRQKLSQRIDSIFSGCDDEASCALRAIRFVQDEIRYLGFEEGLNSHKPHAPLKVFDQRFGDCKDKSLLLCELLRLKNIDAFPVLVSTVSRDKITNELPSIHAFNHCVVRMEINNKVFYVDPTINNQGGSLESNYFPTYGKGLVVNETTDDLTDLPTPVTSEISEVQTFEVPALSGEAIMRVRTTYTGREADYIRGQFLSSSLESTQKNYLNYYANLYPDLEVLEPLSRHDDRRGNIFSVEENYRIPEFWKQNEAVEEQMFCEVYPQTLETYFNVSKSSQRTAPYGLPYPVSYHHFIHIQLPEEWNVEPDDKLIESAFYQYEHLTRYAFNEVTLQTHYETKQDFIPVEAFEQFVNDHEQMMNNLTFQLTYNKNIIANEKGVSWMGIAVALVALAFGIWLVLRLYYYYDPEPAFRRLHGLPIGGWLILPCIGLCIGPVRILVDLFNTPEVYDSQMWANLLTLNRYGLFAFILTEHIYNMVLVPFSILVLLLFLQRRSSLPRLITIYLGATCFVTVADTVVTMQIDSTVTVEAGYYRDMISSIIAAAIWIPYFNSSTRVKETFVKRVYNDDDDAYQPQTVGADQHQSMSGQP